MKVAILGTGGVGQALSVRLQALGHEVFVGTRNPKETLANTTPNGWGEAGPGVFFSAHTDIQLLTYRDAAAKGDIVLNATSGKASLAVLDSIGAGVLDSKVVVDISNPIDFSTGSLRMTVPAHDSLAEQIQARFSQIRVVKALNTLTAKLMLEPEGLREGEHTVFIAGNDADAKREVSLLLQAAGWKDILDLGGLESARGMEHILPLWLKVMETLGTANFQFKIVR